MPAYYISKIPRGFIWAHCRGGLCPMFMSAPALFYSRWLLNFSIDLSSSFYDFTMHCVIKQRPALQQHHRSCVIYDMPVCNCMTCKPPDNQVYQYIYVSLSIIRPPRQGLFVFLLFLLFLAPYCPPFMQGFRAVYVIFLKGHFNPQLREQCAMGYVIFIHPLKC